MSRVLSLIAMMVCLEITAFTPAHARLGESEQSIEVDRKALNAVAPSASIAHDNLYTVHEMESGSGKVREYVDSSGTVFAISWEGLVHPDLSKLLSANHFTEYKQELKKSPRPHGHRHHHCVRGAHVVVEKWGHMRHLQGRAYLLKAVPKGVDIDGIR